MGRRVLHFATLVTLHTFALGPVPLRTNAHMALALASGCPIRPGSKAASTSTAPVKQYVSNVSSCFVCLPLPQSPHVPGTCVCAPSQRFRCARQPNVWRKGDGDNLGPASAQLACTPCSPHVLLTPQESSLTLSPYSVIVILSGYPWHLAQGSAREPSSVRYSSAPHKCSVCWAVYTP